MSRNRWQVPGTEWVRILRGPRPPSAKWPKAGQQQQRQPATSPKPLQLPFWLKAFLFKSLLLVALQQVLKVFAPR